MEMSVHGGKVGVGVGVQFELLAATVIYSISISTSVTVSVTVAGSSEMITSSYTVVTPAQLSVAQMMTWVVL